MRTRWVWSVRFYFLFLSKAITKVRYTLEVVSCLTVFFPPSPSVKGRVDLKTRIFKSEVPTIPGFSAVSPGEAIHLSEL